MTNHELTLGRWYRYDNDDRFMIDMALYKSGSCWLMIQQNKSGYKSQFLSRQDAENVTVNDNSIFIQSDNLHTFLERGYVLGTRYDGRYTKLLKYKPARSNAWQ